MIRKFLNKYYIFVYIILFLSAVYLLIASIKTKSSVTKLSLVFLLLALCIVITFNAVKVYFTRDKGSYRTMLLERPMFNPRGSSEKLKSIYPLHPKFVSVYLDTIDVDEKLKQVIDIEAVRYEKGYITDSLFLPIQKDEEKKKKRFLSYDEAMKYLNTYCKDFPIIVYDKDFCIEYTKKFADPSIFYNSIDIKPIAKMIYPSLGNYDIESLYDYLHFEVDVEDKYYGSRLITAVYLDYLRLNKFYTNPSLGTNAQDLELESVYPDRRTGVIE